MADEVDLPKGVAAVRKRAEAAGFEVTPNSGWATTIGKRKVLLWTESGEPETTETGRQRSKMEPFDKDVTSIGLKIAGHGQGQFGTWVDGDFKWALAWPLDHSDIPRAVGAKLLGTVVDLDALREQSIAAARVIIDTKLSLDAIRARAIGGSK